MINPTILKFFKELFNRLKTKSPKFFGVLQVFGASLTLAGYIPGMMERWTTIEVSAQLINICEDISRYATGFMVACMLSAEAKSTAMTEGGDVIKKMDEEKYPYTARVEQKKVENAEVPVVKDPMELPTTTTP